MSRKRKSKIPKRALLVSVAVVAIIGALALRLKQVETQVTPVLDSSSISNTIAALPQVAGKHPSMRLDPGLTPPTNKWFSSVAFSATPQPIYAYPLSFKPMTTGFEAGYPPITGSPDTVFGSHAPAVIAAMGSTAYAISAYDDLSVDIRYTDASQKTLATSKVTHGSPFVYTTAQEALSVVITTREKVQRVNDYYYVTTYAGQKHGIYSQSAITVQPDGLHMQLAKGQVFSVAAIPADMDALMLESYAADPITATHVSYHHEGANIRTNFDITTASSKPTLFALMPHQRTENAALATYRTLYGDLRAVAGKTFSYSLPAPAVDERINIASLPEPEKDELRSLTSKDIAATTLQKPDTYFAGKELERAANLLELADQLGLTTEKQRLADAMREKLDDWLEVSSSTTGKHFYYDTVMKGIVGVQPSFGSEQFNDHHFHYGYYIYASAVLARHDQVFLQKNKPMIDVLVATVANSENTNVLPRLRNFDPYVGHSWAAGYSDFADGNNQESVSEAVNAWYGILQWAHVSKNAPLAAHAQWLYQHETQAALRYWLYNESQPPAGYRAEITSIVWGGKRDYATWFSARPQAKLGILLIPMSPGHSYLKQSIDKIPAILAAAAPKPSDFQGQFADYMAMYMSLDNKAEAAQKARNLKDQDIDDANSRAYMMAWIYTR